MFEPLLTRWSLTADGEPIFTHSSNLLPVRRDGEPAMLKITCMEEERRGGGLMQWWGGDGAARVLAREGDALLLERAESKQSLLELSRSGSDGEACQIICRTAELLHAPRPMEAPVLMPLAEWFSALWPAARTHGDHLKQSAKTAKSLLATQRDATILHGDIHHGNILYFGARGWLAIDPKGLKGERGYDFAHLFCNPDMMDSNVSIARLPSIFTRRLDIVSAAAQIERRRLIEWIIGTSGLAAAWIIQDGRNPYIAFAICALAEAALAA